MQALSAAWQHWRCLDEVGTSIFWKAVPVSSSEILRFLGRLSRLTHPPAIIDLRLPSSKAAAQQRSINLAISHRGIAALEAIDPAVADRFLHDAIPMRGRMIHALSGEQKSQLYDRDGQVSPTLVFVFLLQYSIAHGMWLWFSSASIPLVVNFSTKAY